MIKSIRKFLASERGAARARILVGGSVAATAIAVLAVATGPVTPPDTSCATTLSSGGNIATALTSVANGATVCLNGGTYSFNATVSKSAMTTVRPAAGAGTITFSLLNVNTSNNLRFQGPANTVGFDVGTATTSATNIQISNMNSTADACVNAPSNVANNILIDKIVFNNVGQGCTEGRLGVHGRNTSKSVNQNIRVQNSTFTGSGPSDGFQTTGEPRGVIVGPGNIFANILEGGCGAVHCDGVQMFAASQTQVVGNYFYNDSTLAEDFDCNSGFTNISGNVFYQEPGSAADAVALSGEPSGLQVVHNTFGPNTNLHIYGGNPGSCTTSNAVIRDNINQGGFSISNCTSCTQTNNITNPTYVGGSLPAFNGGDWTPWGLTSGSAGKGTATDGGDVGAVGATGACVPTTCP